MPEEKPAAHRRVMIHGLTPTRKSDSAEPKKPTAPFLIGHGYDLHRLQPGGTLTLGGVVVSNEVSAIAHSDGDVVLHAIVDALLGAMGLGDIGQHFQNTDPRWKDMASKKFVAEVNGRVTKAGYRVLNLDITLLLEEPKIGAHRAAMIDAIRGMFDPSTQINLKAGTNEGCDAVGRGEAVAAHAVVLLSAAR